MLRLGLLALTVALPRAATSADLVDVYGLALRHDPQLRAAKHALDAASEERPIARALLLPQLDASASYGIERTEITADDPENDERSGTESTEPYDYGLDLRQAVFDREAIVALRQAGDVVAAAEAAYRAAAQDLILRTASAYFEVLASEDELRLARAERDAVKRQLDQAESRLRVGVATLTDARDARARHDLARAAILERERELASARQALAEIIATLEPSLAGLRDEIPLPAPTPADVEAWVAEARELNLDLIAARLVVEIAAKEVARGRAGHFPTLSLEGSQRFAESSGFNQGEIEESALSIRLNLPLLRGLGTLARVRQSKSVREQREAELEGVERAVERLVRDAFLGVTSGAAEVRALRRAVESNRSALEASEAGLRVGTRTIVDVLNAQRLLFQAERDAARARYDYLLSVLGLKRAAGRLHAPDLADINAVLVERP